MLKLYSPSVQRELVKQAQHGLPTVCWLGDGLPDQAARDQAKLLSLVLHSALLIVEPCSLEPR